ncbi:MAG: ATP-binding protein [Thermoplasmatota archaeon]
MQVGAIFGSVATTEFRFIVTDAGLKRTDYIQVRHPTDGWVLAQVTEIVRETRPDGDRLVAHAKALGFRDDKGILHSPRTPFPADAAVHRADENVIADVFGLRSRDGAYIGFVKGYELPVFLDVNALVQKHVSVLAKTGSGKSYVVGVLIEELLKKGVPVVVIDPHGEHASLARPNARREDWRAMQRFGVRPRGYGESIVAYSPDTKINQDCAPLTLEDRNPGASDVVELLGGSVPAAQVGILHHAVKTLRETKRTWNLADVLEAVLASNAGAKWTLASSLEHLVGLGIFDERGTPTESLVLRSKVSIINLKGVGPELSDIVVARLVRRLFEARKTDRIPPFLLVVEEAHNFCPERGLATALSGDVLRTVAAEGRKFGMGLAIISQRPAKVDKNVLSQCNTQVILKVTNPNDLKAIQTSVEGLTADAHDEIQRLPVGVALVSHPRISVPLLVEVRPRETAHGGESVDVMEIWHGGAAEAEPADVLPAAVAGATDPNTLTPAPAEPTPPPARAAPRGENVESAVKPKGKGRRRETPLDAPQGDSDHESNPADEEAEAEPPKPAARRRALPTPDEEEVPEDQRGGLELDEVRAARFALSLVHPDRLPTLSKEELVRLEKELASLETKLDRVKDFNAETARLARRAQHLHHTVVEETRRRSGILGGLRERFRTR